VQRDLRRFAASANEQQDSHQARGNHGRRVRHERCVDAVQVERAERRVEQEHAEQEAGVADAVGDERLLARGGLRRVLEPEADQQVRGEAHALPAHEEHEERAPQHQEQHEEEEQVQVREVARIRLVLAHVADRIDVDERAHAGHDEGHHGGQAIEVEGDLDHVGPSDEPGVRHLDHGCVSRPQVEEVRKR
jgi:hypothetical protein